MLATHWVARISILTLAHVAGTVPIVSVMAMAPVIQRDLGLSVTQVGLLVSGYYIAQTIGAVPAGALADRIGVGRALLASHALLIAGALAFSQADGFAAAVTATVVMGFGYSMVNPSTAKGILTWFSARRRATAMGVKQTGVPIGGVLAAANGALVTLFSWQSIFVTVAGVIFVNGILCLMLVEPRRHAARTSIAATIRQMLQVGRIPNIRVLFLANISWNMGQTNFYSYLTIFMREAAGASQPVAGLVLGLAQVSSALGRIGWGVASDTLFGGARKWITVGLCGASVVLMLAMAAVEPGFGVLLGVVLAFGLGMTIASYATLAQTLAVESVELGQSGAALGYSLMGTSIGGVVGPPIFGAIVDYTGDFADGWITTAIFVALGTVMVAVAVRERHRAPPHTRARP
ncbi:MAG: MFS transporter [Gammaproteobacteria bacterium]|nr:MAG: MFS transporter [Gammaproteobacteria bacterium]